MKSAEIISRCERKHDCLIWPGGVNNRGHPQVHINRKNALARRIVFEAEKNWLPSPKTHAIRMTCQNLRCLNHEHMEVMSRARLVSETHAVRTYGSLLEARLKQGTLLDLEKARKIRQDKRRAADVAAEFGVSQTIIRKIRRNECWKEPAPEVKVLPSSAGKYQVQVPIDKAITHDWMTRRQGAEIPSRFPPEFWANR